MWGPLLASKPPTASTYDPSQPSTQLTACAPLQTEGTAQGHDCLDKLDLGTIPLPLLQATSTEEAPLLKLSVGNAS